MLKRLRPPSGARDGGSEAAVLKHQATRTGSDEHYMSSFSAFALGMTFGFLSANAPSGLGFTQTMRSQIEGKRKTRFTSATFFAAPSLTIAAGCGLSMLPPAATNFFTLVAP